MQGTLPQNQSPPWAQESDYRCMPDASARYLERPVQAGALFRKGLSCRQADGAFRCYFQGGGPGSTSQAGLYFQGRTGRRVRLRPSSISFFPAVPAAVFLRPFSFCFGYRFVSNFFPSPFSLRKYRIELSPDSLQAFLTGVHRYAKLLCHLQVTGTVKH